MALLVHLKLYKLLGQILFWYTMGWYGVDDKLCGSAQLNYSQPCPIDSIHATAILEWKRGLSG